MAMLGRHPSEAMAGKGADLNLAIIAGGGG